MSWQAVLFDLDGTLLDTLEDIAAAVNRVLAAHQLPQHPAAAYRNFVGDGSRMLVTRALPPEHRRVEMIDACLEEFREEYRRNWDQHTKPYPGVPELLDALQHRGVKMAVLSNKFHDFTLLCVRKLLGRWRFDAVLGLAPPMKPKPDPGGALQVAAKLGLPPEKILYVGDSGVDMQTANRAGMYPLGVLWGFRPPEELLAAGARSLVAAPSEALRFCADR